MVVYLSVLARGGTLGPVKMAQAAIRYFHVKHGGVSPTDDSKVAQLLVALKRKLGKPVVKRAPINSEMLLSLVKHFLPEGMESPQNVLNFRWACLFSIQYFASARFEEAIHLNIGDLIFTPDLNVLVTFRKAKNNQYGNALQSVISNMDSLHCPFGMLKIYINILVEARQGFNDALFPSIFQSGKIKKGSRVMDNFARRRSVPRNLDFTPFVLEQCSLH